MTRTTFLLLTFIGTFHLLMAQQVEREEVVLEVFTGTW